MSIISSGVKICNVLNFSEKKLFPFLGLRQYCCLQVNISQ